ERALPSAKVATGAAFTRVTWAGITSAAGLPQLAARTTRSCARVRRRQHSYLPVSGWLVDVDCRVADFFIPRYHPGTCYFVPNICSLAPGNPHKRLSKKCRSLSRKSATFCKVLVSQHCLNCEGRSKPTDPPTPASVPRRRPPQPGHLFDAAQPPPCGKARE